MYRTQLGVRCLGPIESLAFKAMLEQILPWCDPRVKQNQHDEENTGFGVAVFDSMTFGQKLWSLRLVAKALLDESEPPPPLHAYVEATVATILTQGEFLLDVEEESEDAIPFRSMVVDALIELDDGLSESEHQQSADSFLIESLEEAILFDNDFDNTERMDAPPEVARAVGAMMGIPSNYFTELPPDPPEAELRDLYAQLLRLATGNGIVINRVRFRVELVARLEGVDTINSAEGALFLTDGHWVIEPDIEFWTCGNPDVVEEEIWNNYWPDGSFKPCLRSDRDIICEADTVSTYSRTRQLLRASRDGTRNTP